MDTQQKQAIAKIISLMDLTSLNDDDTPDRITALCSQANTAYGAPAAVCIYPAFIETANRCLKESGLRSKVRIATVTNFPAGGDDISQAAQETRRAIGLGADEVDVVFPWRALMQGDEKTGLELVKACRAACGPHLLKVIIESGELKDAGLIRKASSIAIEAGTDFIKTSTGKVPVNATPEAARIMLQVIAQQNRHCGFKAAGGVRNQADAQVYLDLAAEILGENWVTPAHFRFGTSSLLSNLLATLDAAVVEGY